MLFGVFLQYGDQSCKESIWKVYLNLGPYLKITFRLPAFIHDRNNKSGSELCLGNTALNLECSANCSKIGHCFIIFSILKISMVTSSFLYSSPQVIILMLFYAK
jgi:hypothetical protein